MTRAPAELAKMLADPKGARKSGRRGGRGHPKQKQAVYRPRPKEALSQLKEGSVAPAEDDNRSQSRDKLNDNITAESSRGSSADNVQYPADLEKGTEVMNLDTEAHVLQKPDNVNHECTSHMWWLGEEGWPWVCSEGESTAAWGWSESESTNDGDYIPGDETFVGPDGEIYDIFYPDDCLQDCTPEKLTPVSPPVDSQSSAESSPSSSGSRPRQIAVTTWDQSDLTADVEVIEVSSPRPETSSPRPETSRQLTSAEAGIADILTHMRTVAVERHPARARLFELVRSVVAEALGQHFERCALVGSTALRIDTPDSDLDAVVFTRSILNDDGSAVYAPVPSDALGLITHILRSRDSSLQLQLVDCTRVPVLTVLTADGSLSLDLTVDQPMSEWHVHWLQSLRRSQSMGASMCEVPRPSMDEWEQGLEASCLRCVKWWLRRRRIPVAKEGGYPTVVWTLMVVHMLRCTLFVNEDGSCSADNSTTAVDKRTLLGAIAAFFDRFAGQGLAGQLFFAGGTHAVFRPQASYCDEYQQQLPMLPSASFSVLDPTTTSEGSAAWGIVPLELAPQISPATQLLHAYELSRAQQLSSSALVTTDNGDDADRGGVALGELFEEVSASLYTLPVTLPTQPTGVMLLCDGFLVFGILERINLKTGWAASFLYRRDTQSKLAIRLCNVDASDQSIVPHGEACSLHWASPCDIVCMASISRRRDKSGNKQRRASAALEMDADGWERWCKMHGLLGSSPTSKWTHNHNRAGQGAWHRQRNWKQPRTVRI